MFAIENILEKILIWKIFFILVIYTSYIRFKIREVHT